MSTLDRIAWWPGWYILAPFIWAACYLGGAFLAAWILDRHK